MFVSQHHTRCEQWSTLREMLPSRGRSEPHHQPNWGTGRAVPPSLVGTRASRFPVYDSQMTRLSPTDRPTDRASSHGSHSPTLLQTDGQTEGHSIYRASIASRGRNGGKTTPSGGESVWSGALPDCRDFRFCARMAAMSIPGAAFLFTTVQLCENSRTFTRLTRTLENVFPNFVVTQQ